MSVVHEILLPEAKPAYEWILGGAVQKASPSRAQTQLQRIITQKLVAWAAGRGDAGPEWRFRLLPAESLERRPLVPDVAYISRERLAPLSDEEIEVPTVAPELVVEIVSPDGREKLSAAKREVYLAAGVRVVIEVDPSSKAFLSSGPGGDSFRTGLGESWEHPEFPGLQFVLDEIFAVLSRSR